jgi:hypothetical protein
MADHKNKWADNVPVESYVDKECILCSAPQEILLRPLTLQVTGTFTVAEK